MSNKLYDYYKGLPTWGKGIAVLTVLGATVWVGYKIYRAAFPSEEEQRNLELAKNIGTDIDRFRATGIQQTFTDANYNTFANSIYDSMRYAVGDDYGNVVSICKKMMNSLDVALLIDAFGIRQNYVFGLPAGNPKDMITFISSELGNEWGGLTSYRVTQINNDWNAKGIAYRI